MHFTKSLQYLMSVQSKFLLKIKFDVFKIDYQYFHIGKPHEKQKNCYIKTPAAAKMISINLNNSLTENDVFIVCNSVQEHLLEDLLKFNRPLLLLKPQKTLLEQLKKNHPSKIELVNISQFNLMDINRIFWSTKYVNDSRSLEFTNLLQSICTPSSNLKFVGVIDSLKILYNLGVHYAYQEMLFKDYCNPSFYIFVPYFVYYYFGNCMKASKYKKNWRIPFFLKIFFDISFFGSQPLSSFQVSKEYQDRARKLENKKFYELCFVKITPKDINKMKEVRIECFRM